jgi:hypothetical protein
MSRTQFLEKVLVMKIPSTIVLVSIDTIAANFEVETWHQTVAQKSVRSLAAIDTAVLP